jgi:hypothetical protein
MQNMADQKQRENVEYFSYLGSIITNAARSTRVIASRIAVTKVALDRKKTFHLRTELQTKEKMRNVTYDVEFCMAPKLEHLGE